MGEKYLSIAQELIDTYNKFTGKTRGELDEEIKNYIGYGTDYKIKRGLARILQTECSEFNITSKILPSEIRRRLFHMASDNFPITERPDRIHPVTRRDIINQVASEMGVTPIEIEEGLYADLMENHILSTFQEPESSC